MTAAGKRRLYWSRMVACLSLRDVSMLIECQDEPRLFGQPLAIVDGGTPARISAVSAAADEAAVNVGMTPREALRQCPELVIRAARPDRYAESVMRLVVALRQQIGPLIELSSSDTLYIDLSRVQSRFSSAQAMFACLHAVTGHVLGESAVALGISGDKTTARVAAGRTAVGETTIIPPWHAAAYLNWLPVTEVLTPGTIMADFLRQQEIAYCGQIRRLPMASLRRRFGQSGKQLWLRTQGRDPTPVAMPDVVPSGISASKILPPSTSHRAQLEAALFQCVSRLSAKLRQSGLQTRQLCLSADTGDGQFRQRYRLARATEHDSDLLLFCQQFLDELGQVNGIDRVQASTQALVVSADDDRSLRQDPLLMGCMRRLQEDLSRRFGRQETMRVALHQRTRSADLSCWRPGQAQQDVV